MRRARSWIALGVVTMLLVGALVSTCSDAPQEETRSLLPYKKPNETADPEHYAAMVIVSRSPEAPDYDVPLQLADFPEGKSLFAWGYAVTYTTRHTYFGPRIPFWGRLWKGFELVRIDEKRRAFGEVFTLDAMGSPWLERTAQPRALGDGTAFSCATPAVCAELDAHVARGQDHRFAMTFALVDDPKRPLELRSVR